VRDQVTDHHEIDSGQLFLLQMERGGRIEAFDSAAIEDVEPQRFRRLSMLLRRGGQRYQDGCRQHPQDAAVFAIHR
jgi:hypothetical protein